MELLQVWIQKEGYCLIIFNNLPFTIDLCTRYIKSIFPEEILVVVADFKLSFHEENYHIDLVERPLNKFCMLQVLRFQKPQQTSHKINISFIIDLQIIELHIQDFAVFAEKIIPRCLIFAATRAIIDQK